MLKEATSRGYCCLKSIHHFYKDHNCYISNFAHAQFVRLPSPQSDLLAGFESSNLPSKYVKQSNANRPYPRQPPSLHALKDRWNKSKNKYHVIFQGEKTGIKFANTSNHSRVCLFSQNVRTINILIVMRWDAQFKFRHFLRHQCLL